MAVAPVIIEASGQKTASVIFLHGLGDTGHGWASTLASIKPSHAKVICPTAEQMPVSLNAGYRMPSWFDLYSLDIAGKEDLEGIRAAAKKVHALIDKEVADGVPANRVVLGGFSQGGALALYSGLTYAKKLAGVVSLSCWLPDHKNFPKLVAGNPNLDTPILQCHGDCDPVVPFKWGQMTSSVLKTIVKNITFKSYSGLQHSSSPEELEDIQNFISSALPPN